MTELFTDTVLNMMTTTAEPEDYTGEDGLLYCGKCHTPKEAFFAKGIVLMGKNKQPVECCCQRMEREKQEALLRVKKEMKQSVTTGATERNWVTLFKQYENIEELNRRVLMALVDRILIYEDHAIEIVFKYKDEYQQTLEYVLGYADELAIAG